MFRLLPSPALPLAHPPVFLQLRLFRRALHESSICTVSKVLGLAAAWLHSNCPVLSDERELASAGNRRIPRNTNGPETRSDVSDAADP